MTHQPGQAARPYFVASECGNDPCMDRWCPYPHGSGWKIDGLPGLYNSESDALAAFSQFIPPRKVQPMTTQPAEETFHPDIRGMSGSDTDRRCLELWFKVAVTDSDRAWLLEAIKEKMHRAPAQKLPDPMPYVPTLLKLDDPPRLEYVSKDCAAIYNPVDANFFYITDMETRKIVGFQFLLPRGPQPLPPMSERREFSLEGTGFTLRECGCTEGFCDGRTDGTCTFPSTYSNTAVADSTGDNPGTHGASKEAGGHSRGGLTPVSTLKRTLPVMVPDKNSASGYRVEHLSFEVDADLARVLDSSPPTECGSGG